MKQHLSLYKVFLECWSNMRVMVNTVIEFSLSFIIYMLRHHLSNAVSHSTSLWFESNDVPGEELRKLNIANIQFSCNDLINLTAILIWNLELRAKIDYTIIYQNSHVGTQRRLRNFRRPHYPQHFLVAIQVVSLHLTFCDWPLNCNPIGKNTSMKWLSSSVRSGSWHLSLEEHTLKPWFWSVHIFMSWRPQCW